MLDTFKYKHTPEDAETLAAELIPSNLLADLGDSNWKTRLAALEELQTWVEEVVEEVDAEVVTRALAKKGWNEKNFQVGFFRHRQGENMLQYLEGIGEDIWHSHRFGGTLSIVWKIMPGPMCRTSQRKTRGFEVEETCGGHVVGVR
jgi:hypothetical protein